MGKILLDIPAGINSGDTAYSASGAWLDCDKVRFWRGKGQVVGGWERFIPGELYGFCRSIFPWTDNGSNLLVAFGTNTSLQIAYGGGIYDVTPTSFVEGNVDAIGGAGWGTGTYGTGLYGAPSTGDIFALTWSFSNYGQSQMANPRGQTIFWWQNDVTTPTAPLTNAPAVVTYMLVPHTRQVMAFGCNEEVSGDFNAMCIRFSDIEDPTDWTTSPSNNAGEVIIEGGSRIVAARLIGNYIFVWTDQSLFLGTFTGDTAQPWTFEKQADHCGLLGPNAAVIVNQNAFWLSTDVQFYSCSLGGAPQIIVSPIQDELKSNLAIIQSDKVVASSCTRFGEVRFDYPDQRDDIGAKIYTLLIDEDGGDYIAVDDTESSDIFANAIAQDAGIENSRYFSLSTIDGSWSKGYMPRTYYVDSGPQQYPISVTAGGIVYLQERGNTADGSAFSWFIESADQFLGEAGDPMLMITGMYPDFKDQIGPISVDVTMKRYPQDRDFTKGPYTLEVNRQQRCFQASGRVVRVKFSGNSGPTYARLGNFAFDTIPTGQQ